MTTLTQLAFTTALGVLAVAVPALAQEAPDAQPDQPARKHRVITEVTAVGAPVVSPDGKWIAVRDKPDYVVVFDPSAPATERQGFQCIPPANKQAWVWTQTAAPAVFADDSSAVVIAGQGHLTYMTLGAETSIAQHEVPGEITRVLPARGGVWPVVYSKGNGWYLWLWTPEGWRGEAAAITHPSSVAWIDHPSAVAATTVTGECVAIDPKDASATTLATADEVKAAIPNLEQKPIQGVRLLHRGSSGALLFEAPREARRVNRVKMGRGMSRQLAPDEKPTRGRNPGSAEPPPPLPVYRLLKSGDRVHFLSCISKARWLDTWIEAPSADGRQFLRLQVANAGGAGRGTPAIWTHLRMWPGEFEEHELGTGGLMDGLQAPRFEWLDVAADGESGLVFMRAQREFTFDLDDAAMLKKYAPNLPPGEAGKRMAVVFLMQHFERGGATGSTLSFAHQGVYRVSARGKLTPLATGFGETLSPFHDHTGLPGVMGTPVWCAATRTLVASLHSPRDRAVSRGLVLIPVPK